jgi:IS30 family transposase
MDRRRAKKLDDLLKAGKTADEIATALQRTPPSIYTRLQLLTENDRSRSPARRARAEGEEMMPISRHRRPWTTEEDERLRSMVEASMSIHLIAAKLNRSTEGIRARASILKISFKRARLGLKAKAR